MKPITASNLEGRALLALRAGPMTIGEINERLGTSLPRCLLTAGLVEATADGYRLTGAGLTACPYRNPLAAPGVVKPYTLETDMSRENPVTRQQVLAAIVEAGPAGMTRQALLERFGCPETNIDIHIMRLNKQTPAVIVKPAKGRFVAAEHWRNPTPAAVAEVPAVTPGPESPVKIAPKSPSTAAVAPAEPAEPVEPAVPILAELDMASLTRLAASAETIEVKAIADRRAPLAIAVDEEHDFELGISSDGSLALVIDTGLDDCRISFSKAALDKLVAFCDRHAGA